mgnify:FL=1|jgi:DNA adenine methylase
MNKNKAKPFLKWAGGKTKLLQYIENKIPYKTNEVFTFIEPFVGSGAVLFQILNNYPNIEKVVINDINTDLIITYKTISNSVEELIELLQRWELEYHKLSDNEDKKKEYYYNKRDLFNKRNSNKVNRSALFIFLNRTCFNGLYRVNRKNLFNVPIGSYKKPTICNKDNLRLVSELLQKVTILNGDYTETVKKVKGKSLFYLDPPYKPLNQSSSFNSYAKDQFDDNEQIRLKEFCDLLDSSKHKWILSNSDVKNTDMNDDFFDDLYEVYSINRVLAKRSINSISSKRGSVSELLISNM